MDLKPKKNEETEKVKAAKSEELKREFENIAPSLSPYTIDSAVQGAMEQYDSPMGPGLPGAIVVAMIGELMKMELVACQINSYKLGGVNGPRQ